MLTVGEWVRVNTTMTVEGNILNPELDYLYVGDAAPDIAFLIEEGKRDTLANRLKVYTNRIFSLK